MSAPKPFYLFGIPNEETETTDYGLKVPNLASIILTGKAAGEIPGLQDVTKEERPPVSIVFWSFRVMVGLGIAMILTGIIAAWLYWRKKLFNLTLFQIWCIAMGPSGFVSLLAGWFVTEVGRQPYTAYGILKTSESISPVIAEQVAISLALFVIIYTIIFGAGVYYMFKIWRKGPAVIGDGQKYYCEHNIETLMDRKISDGISNADKKGGK